MTEEKEKDLVEETTKETAEETTEEKAQETVEEISVEDKLKEEIESLKDKLMRNLAEFDNYKKRTQKEREDLYATAVCDTIEKMLPVKDNLERALTTLADAEESVLEGIKMIDKQFSDVLKAQGIEEIKSVGEAFDPEKHNAVMREDAEDKEENTITEEFQKGYIYKEEKVIRYSMVKVAN